MLSFTRLKKKDHGVAEIPFRPYHFKYFSWEQKGIRMIEAGQQVCRGRLPENFSNSPAKSWFVLNYSCWSGCPRISISNCEVASQSYGSREPPLYYTVVINCESRPGRGVRRIGPTGLKPPPPEIPRKKIFTHLNPEHFMFRSFFTLLQIMFPPIQLINWHNHFPNSRCWQVLFTQQTLSVVTTRFIVLRFGQLH